MEVDRAVFEKYQTMKQELQSLGEKLSELQMDADEHRIVVAALSPLDENRKCWRRVGGVLVEDKVSTTLPILKTNLQGVINFFPIPNAIMI